MAHVAKSEPDQARKVTGSSTSVGQPSVAKSNLKAGFGIFKDTIISKPAAWRADLRRTVK